jgi:uncharacterized protein
MTAINNFQDGDVMDKFIPPCKDCGGKCCDYVAVEMKIPSCKKDYDSIRWYLSHENVNVFVDHFKTWYVEFRTPCMKMNINKKCTIYKDRPFICRNHGNSEGECEHFDTPYKEYFTSMRDFEKYLENKKIDWKFRYSDKN